MTTDGPTTGGSLPRSLLGASLATIALSVVAAAVGLFVPGFYRDAAVLRPQLYGQDALTLFVAVPAFALGLYAANRGSLRGHLAWVGVAGYLLYTYASYAFVTAFNELFVVYAALLWLTLVVFVGGLLGLDADAVKRSLADLPVGVYAAFETAFAALVAAMWLSDVVPATLSGTVPASVADAGLPTSVIYALDLGVVAPAFVLSAYWLWTRRAWGYALTAVLLVKVATLGGAVLSMAALLARAGQPAPLPQVVVFGSLTLVSVALMARLLLGIDPDAGDRSASLDADGRIDAP